MSNTDKKKDTGFTVPTLTADDVRFVARLLNQPAQEPKAGFVAARDMYNRFLNK